MFGLVVLFTLKEGQGEAFDALTRQTVARIRAEEPGTLVYACHAVDGDSCARVFYELYRDREAFDEHERQDHVRHFLSQRGQYMDVDPRVEFLHLQDAKGVPGAG